MTQISMIPLDQLGRSDLNVRKITGAGIEELAASIQRDDLIQNLTVTAVDNEGRPGPNYLVVAGGRRLAALQLLASKNQVDANMLVPCRVVGSGEAEALSLAENQLREAMHPVDQLEAFCARINAGDTVTDVAARFGVTEAFVKQRMRLSTVSPKLLQECRDGNMTLEALQAFSVTDDHEKQEDLWNENKRDIQNGYLDQGDIKGNLLDHTVDSNSPLLKFVGLASYQKAGGALIEADMFSEHSKAVVSDPDLLDRMVKEKIEKKAAKLKKSECLAFVDVLVGVHWFDPNHHADYWHATRYRAQPSDEQSARIQALEAQIEDLCKKQDVARDNDDDELYDKLCDEEGVLQSELDALEDSLEQPHPDEAEHIGAVIVLRHGASKPDVHRNVIRREHRAKRSTGNAAGNSSSTEDKPRVKYSEKLVRDMTTHKTMILRNAILGTGVSALITLIYDMLVDQYGDELGLFSKCLTISQDWRSGHVDEVGPAAELFAKRERELIDPIVAVAEQEDSEAAVYGYLVQLLLQEQLELLSLLVANRTTLVVGRAEEQAHSQILVDRYLTDEEIALHWRPYRDTFLGSVSKPVIMAALAEACGQEEADKLATMKKGEAIDHAEPLLVNSTWLPDVMRVGDGE